MVCDETAGGVELLLSGGRLGRPHGAGRKDVAKQVCTAGPTGKDWGCRALAGLARA
jgi:hypothetical protein